MNIPQAASSAVPRLVPSQTVSDSVDRPAGSAPLNDNIVSVAATMDPPPIYVARDLVNRKNRLVNDPAVTNSQVIVLNNPRRNILDILGIFLREAAKNSPEFKQSLDQDERQMAQLKKTANTVFYGTGQVQNELELCKFCAAIRMGALDTFGPAPYFESVMADIREILSPYKKTVIMCNEDGNYALYLFNEIKPLGVTAVSSRKSPASSYETCL